MLTFEQAFELTNKISSTAAYEKDELRLLFDCAMDGPGGRPILEIGAEYGRSTSLLLQVAKERRLAFTIVEIDPKPELIANLRQFKYPYFLAALNSAAYKPSLPLGFLHIDADHDYGSVKCDLEDFVPFCQGWTVCHDYGRESLPGVEQAVDEYLSTWRTFHSRLERTAFAFRQL